MLLCAVLIWLCENEMLQDQLHLLPLSTTKYSNFINVFTSEINNSTVYYYIYLLVSEISFAR